jgi:predicted transcriptional regulator of viral defense system
MPAHATESALLEAAFQMSPIARARDLRSQRISGTAIARAVEAGQLTRRGRGLYQHTNSHIDAGQSLAEATQLMPKGVICMMSALAWHGLTDQMPRKVWIAIGQKDWAPKRANPPLRIARMTDKYLRQGIELHSISGVDVPIYSIPKTLADVFRNSRAIDRSVAIEALRATLDQRRATPGEIADAANQGGAWNAMRPYLEALTSNG